MKKGWEIKKLGEVCETGAGGTPLKTHKDYYEGGTIPWLLSGEVSQGEVFEATNFITEKGLKNSSAKLFPPNTVLVAMYGATAGQVGILRFEAATNQAVCGILPNDKTIPEYLFYCFLEKKEELVAQAVGGAQPNISQIKIKNTKIPLPPLPEQQRIVSILDEAFAVIAKAKANAEQNLKNAKELFESYLQGVFENGDWENKELGNLCFLITKGSSPKWQGIKYVDEPGILFVTSENVGEGKMLLNERKYVEEKFNLKDKKSILNKGDVLTNIVGASIGRTAIYDIDDVANINQAVCILRCNPELILNNYLMNLLNSPFLKKILHDNEVNTARANLSLGFFNKLEIPCPSLKQQQTIVRQLDALRAETQKLEALYQKKIEDLEELKKSVLQKAFSGELTSSTSTSVSVAKVIPFQKIQGISATDLQAGITAIALQQHSELNKHDSFGHVKAEKIVHLAEYVLNVDLERNPIKDAAGPNDFPHAMKVQSRAAKAGFYTVAKREADQETGYLYTQGRSINSLIQKTQNSLGERNELLSELLKLIVPMKTQQAEIVATVYAAWNNLILKRGEFADEDIVTEARENWREEKLKIPREKFFIALNWMREKSDLLIPKGNGKIVESKRK